MLTASPSDLAEHFTLGELAAMLVAIPALKVQHRRCPSGFTLMRAYTKKLVQSRLHYQPADCLVLDMATEC